MFTAAALAVSLLNVALFVAVTIVMDRDEDRRRANRQAREAEHRRRLIRKLYRPTPKRS